MRWKILILTTCCLMAVPLGTGIAASPQTPQRAVGEQWVRDIGSRDQRGACELQTVKEVGGQPCGVLPSSESVNCPAVFEGAKPPYRKSEIRTVAEQVGAFTEETAGRGFFKIYAQVKAKKLWGTLGVEQVPSGAWFVTYLRFAGETFAPAGISFQSEAWHKLWVSNWCPTNHPKWERNAAGQP